MALRPYAERLLQAGQIVRPRKPEHTAPAHHHRHHAVHMACCWLHELTNAPLEKLHAEFAKHHTRRTKMTKKRLHAAASELMEHLYAHDNLFTTQEYAAIYHQISQGLITEDTSMP